MPRSISAASPGLVIGDSGWNLDVRRPRRSGGFRRALMPSLLQTRNAVYLGGPIVEAFPNAFLGVLTLKFELLSAPKLKRGRRFDWLYDQTATTGRLESALSIQLDMPDNFWIRLRVENDHELRAALICLLTAALAARGTAAMVGEPKGGWFWLPPLSSWQPWARQGLETVSKRMALKGHFLDGFGGDTE